MGDVCDIDWTCEHCQARRYTCIECGEECIVDDDSQSELCERCFRLRPERSELEQLKAGVYVLRPSSIQHAKDMIMVAEAYILEHGGD